MNRKQQIAEAANQYAPYDVRSVDSPARGFYDGAKWADSNPAWHNADEELPEKSCMCVCHDGERMFFAEWVNDTAQGGLSGWNVGGLTNKPIAWLPIPKVNLKSE